MIPQVLVVFGSVSLVLVVITIKVLIAPHRISCHLIWPFKERLILNLFQYLAHWLSEHSINCLSIGKPWLPSEVSSWSVVIVSVRFEIPPLLRDNLSVTFPLLLVFLNPLVLINPVYELAHTSNRFAHQRLLKLCSVGRPTLKVLMATSSKSPSISLYIS